MPELHSNPTEQPQLTPEQLEAARRIIEQEQQHQAGEFVDAHATLAEQQRKIREQAAQHQFEQALNQTPDIPGITRPAVEVQSMPEKQSPIDDLNASLVRGQKAQVEIDNILAGKIQGGGPEAWTNLVADLQDSDQE
jgi:hypothetical protein